jgi:serine/threonine protein kinase
LHYGSTGRIGRSRIIGKTLNHYKILDQLGVGGMGEVYLAEDLKLERKVALKVLPEEFAADADRLSRFTREAKALAAMNHPGIVTIFSVEEALSLRHAHAAALRLPAVVRLLRDPVLADHVLDLLA